MNKLYRIQLITEKGGKITKLVDKEFKVGDLVEYDNEEWKVESIVSCEIEEDIKLVEKKSTWFTPKINERYHFIYHDGDIICNYNNSEFDKILIKNEKVFRTEEEAQKELAKQQATIRVKKRIAELNEGWFPNWKESKNGKWYIEYLYTIKNFNIDGYNSYKHMDNDLYIKTYELAKQLIQEMESDLKLMLEVE